MAAFQITSYGENYVTIKVSGITKGQTVRFFIREDPYPGSGAIDLSYSATGTVMTRSFYGLTPGTDYACNVKTDDNDWIGTQYFTTDEGVSVQPWSWSTSNGSATASQTIAAYSAAASRGSTENFSYRVWNDLVDKALECIDAEGGAWNSRYATYAATRMSASDKILTAVRFNSLRYNIDLGCSTGIGTVYRGGTVYGAYFITLAECINARISGL